MFIWVKENRLCIHIDSSYPDQHDSSPYDWFSVVCMGFSCHLQAECTDKVAMHLPLISSFGVKCREWRTR